MMDCKAGNGQVEVRFSLTGEDRVGDPVLLSDPTCEREPDLEGERDDEVEEVETVSGTGSNVTLLAPKRAGDGGPSPGRSCDSGRF